MPDRPNRPALIFSGTEGAASTNISTAFAEAVAAAAAGGDVLGCLPELESETRPHEPSPTGLPVRLYDLVQLEAEARHHHVINEQLLRVADEYAVQVQLLRRALHHPLMVHRRDSSRRFTVRVPRRGRVPQFELDVPYNMPGVRLLPGVPPPRLETGDLVRVNPAAVPLPVMRMVLSNHMRFTHGRLDRWFKFEVCSDTDPADPNYPVNVRPAPTCAESSDTLLSMPPSWFLPVTDEWQAEMERIRKAPPTPAEQRWLNPRRPLMQWIANNAYDHDYAAVERKMLYLKRGLRSNHLGLRTLRFAERVARARQSLRGCWPLQVEPASPRMARLDEAYKQGAPNGLPRMLDAEGDMVGIELEFVCPKSYKRTNIWGVDLGYDGSVTSHDPAVFVSHDRGYDSEARLLCKFGSWDRLRRACKSLSDQGCVANKSCGLHVHLDMRGKQLADVRRIARRLAASLPFLNCLVPENRWRSDHARRYCAQGYSFRQRYTAINGCSFAEHRTLEVRLFSGSLNADKIIRWVELLHWLSRRTGPNIRSMDEFIACKQAPVELKRWAYNRWQRLYPVVAAAEPLEVSELIPVSTTQS